MSGFRPQISFVFLVLAAAIVISCASPPAHLPQSVNITPATGDGSSGAVQFTATAYYTTMPSPVTPAPATWGACSANGDNSGVSVSNNGLAQCSAGTNRSYIIYAFVPIPNFKGVCASQGEPCGGSCGGVVGTALLNCP